MTTAGYTVSGMTCGHCAASVTAEVTKVDGVSDVQVDVAQGRLTVISDRPVAQSEVLAAVQAAGYEAAPR